MYAGEEKYALNIAQRVELQEDLEDGGGSLASKAGSDSKINPVLIPFPGIGAGGMPAANHLLFRQSKKMSLMTRWGFFFLLNLQSAWDKLS